MVTFVFRVRLCTSPLLSTRSKAKLPFWLTGEKVSRFRCPLRNAGVSLGAGSELSVVDRLVSMGWGFERGSFCGLEGRTTAITAMP